MCLCVEKPSRGLDYDGRKDDYCLRGFPLRSPDGYLLARVLLSLEACIYAGPTKIVRFLVHSPNKKEIRFLRQPLQFVLTCTPQWLKLLQNSPTSQLTRSSREGSTPAKLRMSCL